MRRAAATSACRSSSRSWGSCRWVWIRGPGCGSSRTWRQESFPFEIHGSPGMAELWFSDEEWEWAGMRKSREQ